MLSMQNIRQKTLSLRSFITITIALIVAAVQLCSILFYYRHTSDILHDHSQDAITRQLNQVNSLISEQIDSIDSAIPLFLSSNLIQTTLAETDASVQNQNEKLQIERQMSYIYCSTPLSGKNYVDSIYLLRDDDTVYHTYTSGVTEDVASISAAIRSRMEQSGSHLTCFSLSSDTDTIYFARNLYNGNTGHHMGVMALSVNSEKWMSYCTANLDPSWFITLYHSGLSVLSDKSKARQSRELMEEFSAPQDGVSFQELELCGETYYCAIQMQGALGLVCSVSAPKELLLKDLNNTLKSCLLLLAAAGLLSLLAAVILSRAVTRPIDRMVYQINRIAAGAKTGLPPMKLYREFHLWAKAFNDMLDRLDASYHENFQKQLLLKNAEIQALQSQMDPHFLFNILNTIAWKAQMTDQEEIYQMVVSLGELLRMNTRSKDHPFVTLEKEMEYVKLYIYLQQMRFEDKISCSIQIPSELMQCRIPCFCIQPLVENAIVHGLEPKKGKGRLIVQVIHTKEHLMEICIIDNGVGFSQLPDAVSEGSAGTLDLADTDTSGSSGSSEEASVPGSHTHIGLKNLNKRLELLFGPDARLRISSTPNVHTILSFTIPIQKEELP